MTPSSLLYIHLAVSFACLASAFGPDCSPIATVPDFDLVPYMGVWYEQGTSSIPRDTFQRNLFCTRANYQLGSSFVNVNNSGFIGGPDGLISTALGLADQPDPSVPGALEVTFTDTFTGNPNYFVMAVDYSSYVLIGGPCRLYMWILSRNSTRMDDDTWNSLIDVAVSEGFQPEKIGFRRDVLTGCSADDLYLNGL